MPKLFGTRSGKTKQETRQLSEIGHDDLAGDDKTRQIAPSDSLRALIERALTDAEQIVASIKMKAQEEAKNEAIGIIDQAKQSADEIRKIAEAAQKQVEGVLSAPDIKAEEVPKDKEVEQPAEKEVELVAGESAAEEPVQLEKGATVSEPTKAIAEEVPKQPSPEEISVKEEPVSEPAKAIAEELPKQPSPEEIPAKEEPVSEPTKAIAEELPKQLPPQERPVKEEPVPARLTPDKQGLYDGEIELTIAPPIDPVAVSKLYNQLQMTSEIKILYTRGSWNQGTTITVSLDRPLPLLDIISRTAGIEVTSDLPQQDKSMKGKSSPLLGATKKGVKRIALTLKAK